MKTTTAQPTGTKVTNSLTHKIYAKDKEGNDLTIEIRLSDECKNGHQDFAITATGWQKGKPHTDRYMMYGGCCHDEILAVRPDLKIFVDLHLCDYLGNPMYPVANGFYHLTAGFNKTKPNSPEFKVVFCDCYRITSAQFDILATAKNKIQYYQKLISLNIPSQWRKQAGEGIKLLEQMTGKQFKVDSKRTQMDKPTSEEIAQEAERQAKGYYAIAAEKEREQAAKQALVNEIKAEMNKKIKKYKLEAEVKIEVLEKGGSKALQNCIFYNHTNQLTFNWRGYDNLEDSFIDDLISRLELPVGVTIKNAKK